MVTDARRIPDKIAKPVRRRDGALRIASLDNIKGISASLKLPHAHTSYPGPRVFLREISCGKE